MGWRNRPRLTLKELCLATERTLHRPTGARRAAAIIMMIAGLSILLPPGGILPGAHAGEFTYDEPLLVCRGMDPSVPHPDDFLGFSVGSYPCHHEDLWEYLDALVAASWETDWDNDM